MGWPRPQEIRAGGDPTGAPNADGDTPVGPPANAPAPPEPADDSTRPEPLDELPLTGFETCDGGAHAQRIGAAFAHTRTTTYQALHGRLTELDHRAARIHRMPDRAGAPRARIDLRVLGSRLALEATGADGGVAVDAFGARETEDVNVADVKRNSEP